MFPAPNELTGKCKRDTVRQLQQGEKSSDRGEPRMPWARGAGVRKGCFLAGLGLSGV